MWRWGVVVLVAVAGLALALMRWRTEYSWQTESRVVVSVPFGTGSGMVAKAAGLDGQTYGPLAFAVGGGHLAILDTYHQRIVWGPPESVGVDRPSVAPSGRDVFNHWSSALLRETVPEDVLWAPQSHAWLVADNQNLMVWSVQSPRAHPLIQLVARRGWTESIWHMAVGPRYGHIYLEVVAFGQGGFFLAVREYTSHGHFVRNVAESLSQNGQRLKSLVNGELLSVPVRSFAIGPGGEIYVELPALSTHLRQILEYSRKTHTTTTVDVRSPVPIEESQLMGVSAQGLIYLGINLGHQHHNGWVLVARMNGAPATIVKVPATPVRAAVYGRVGDNGSLYLVENTASRYQVVRIAIHQRKQNVLTWR